MEQGGNRSGGPMVAAALSVLHLVHTTNRRGAEVFATELHAALPEHGVESAIVALQSGDGGLGVEALGIHGRTPLALAALRRRVRSHDLLIAYGASTLLAGSAATIGGPGMIYRSIGDPRFWGDVTARDLRIGAPMRRTARVVALWEGAAEAQREMYRLDDDQVVVIPNGRDRHRFVPVSAEERLEARRRLGVDLHRPLAGFVGSLSWEKQPLLAVEAIARGGDIGLVMAGAGPLEGEVRAAAAAMGDRVKILGSVADPRDVYRAIDVLLLTSRTEGMPGVVIEAGLTGVPSVATDVGATRVLVDDTTGRLVALGADHHPVEALAEALVDVLADPETLGAAALERCRGGFTTDLVVQRWADLITKVASETGSKAVRTSTEPQLPKPSAGAGSSVDRPVRSHHLCATPQRRGAEIFAVDLVAHLNQHGSPATLRALQGDRFQPELGLSTIGPHRFDPTSFLRLRRYLTAGDGTAVAVAHGASTMQAIAAATMRTETPWVYRSIGDPAFWGEVRLSQLRVGTPLRAATRVVTLWQGAADSMMTRYGIESSRISVIANGVVAERFPLVTPDARVTARQAVPLPADHPVIVWSGSLSPEKDPLLAVAVAGRCQDMTLVMLGDGPLRAEVEAAAAKISGGRVRVLGAVEDVQPILATADVLLLTSRTEGLPAVAIEAGLSGIPVVSLDVGGVSEIVVDGQTGLLVGHRSATDLAAAVARAIDGTVDLGPAGRDRCIERFSMQTIGPLWQELLAEVAHG